MLLADEPNIREVIAFPMNQKAEDLMMQAPAEVPPERLRELHIRVQLPPRTKAESQPAKSENQPAASGAGGAAGR